MIREVPPFSHIRVESPDLCHQIGQVLMRPFSYMLVGRSFQIERNGVQELPPDSLLGRIAVVALAILLFPISLIPFFLGTLILSCSRTYSKARIQVEESNILITWDGYRPEIETRQLKIRPIQAEDLPAYQALFNNAVAMQNYRGGVQDITPRFQTWLNRWQEHLFSAFAVVAGDRVIGHTIIDHGDFEAPDHGWSEMSVVIDPAFWNRNFSNDAQGNEGKRKIGTEVVRAMIAYARALKARGAFVPVDVAQGQQVDGPFVHRNAQNQVDWVYAPFTELRAAVHRYNVPAQRMGETLAQQYGATRRILDMERDLYTLQMT